MGYLFKFFILISFLYIHISAQEIKQDFKVKNIISIYDGDTFRVDLRNCSIDFFCKDVSIRVYGVDTEEMKSHSENALKAKEYTKLFLTKTPILLKNCTKDKYYRLDCEVINSSKKNLADELIKNNLGVPYFGGTKI